MPSIKSSAILAGMMASSAFAILPNVTVVPAVGGCSLFPSYDNATGLTDYFALALSHSDNSTIEGWGDTSRIITTSPTTEGRFTFPWSNDLAKTALRCNDAIPALGIQAWSQAGPTDTIAGVAWNQVNATTTSDGSTILGWGFGQDGEDVHVYRHFVAGVQQTGLFLGISGQTGWALKWVDLEGNGEGWWDLRFSGTGSLAAGEVATFVTVRGSV